MSHGSSGLVEPYLGSPDQHIRRLARGAVSRLAVPEVVALQKRWLESDDRDARVEAALAIGLTGDPAAWPVIREGLEGGPGAVGGRGYWQSMVHTAAELCKEGDPTLQEEAAEIARAEIRKRLGATDNTTANEVLDLRRIISAAGPPWHREFLEEQIRSRTCFAEYALGEWAHMAGPAAIPTLVELCDDPVMRRGVIDYLRSRNPRLGTSEDQAPLRARLEALMAQEEAAADVFASARRTELAQALVNLGVPEAVEPDFVDDSMAYEARLTHLGLGGAALLAKLREAFPDLPEVAAGGDSAWGSLLEALHESGRMAVLSANDPGLDDFADALDELLAMAKPLAPARLHGWPERWEDGEIELKLEFGGSTRPFLLTEEMRYNPGALAGVLNPVFAETGHAFGEIDLGTGGEMVGLTFGVREAMARLRKEIALPVQIYY